MPILIGQVSRKKKLKKLKHTSYRIIKTSIHILVQAVSGRVLVNRLMVFFNSESISLRMMFYKGLKRLMND